MLVKIANALSKHFSRLSEEALEKVKNAGMVRSVETYIRGYERGNQNIKEAIKKKGWNVVEQPLDKFNNFTPTTGFRLPKQLLFRNNTTAGMHRVFEAIKPNIPVPENMTAKEGLLAAKIGNRHELDEARAGIRLRSSSHPVLKNYAHDVLDNPNIHRLYDLVEKDQELSIAEKLDTMGLMSDMKNIMRKYPSQPNLVSHLSPEVLLRERKNVNTIPFANVRDLFTGTRTVEGSTAEMAARIRQAKAQNVLPKRLGKKYFDRLDINTLQNNS